MRLPCRVVILVLFLFLAACSTGRAGPTSTPTPVPTAAPAEPAPLEPAATTIPVGAVPGNAYSGPYDPAGPDRNCSDFSTRAEAQAFFEAAQAATGERDRHGLDSNGNGRACETLLR